MKHDRGHSHNQEHSHSDVSTADGRRRVAIAGLLTAGFMVTEVVGGLISGSLALLADAAHMLTDAASLGLAWIGYRLATRPADDKRNYGFSRLRVLAAFTNGIALLALSVWILIEGIQRLLAPSAVLGPLMLAIAIGGLVVNLVAFAVLNGGDQEDLNLSGALWHVAGDVFGSVAAIAAALIIMATGWLAVDPLLSMLVAVLVAVAGRRIVLKAGHILLEGAPDGLTPEAIRADLTANVPDLAAVSHIHSWSLNEKQPMVTLEAAPVAGASPQSLRMAIKDRLAAQFGVTHTTVEIVDKATAASSKSTEHSVS